MTTVHRELSRISIGISGGELAHRAFQQAKRLGAEIVVTRFAQGIEAATGSLVLDGGDVVLARTRRLR